MEVHEKVMYTMSTTMLCTEQNWDITYKNLASQLCHNNKSSFKSFIMSASGILHEVHDSKVTKEPSICLKQ